MRIGDWLGKWITSSSFFLWKKKTYWRETWDPQHFFLSRYEDVAYRIHSTKDVAPNEQKFFFLLPLASLSFV